MDFANTGKVFCTPRLPRIEGRQMRKPKVLVVGLKVSGKQRATLDLLHRAEAIIIDNCNAYDSPSVCLSENKHIG